MFKDFASLRCEMPNPRLLSKFVTVTSSLLLGAACFTVASGAASGKIPQAQDSSTSDTQSQSIADAAKRSRDKAKNSTKSSKVITDDDLDKGKVKPGAQGLNVEAPAKLETAPPPSDDVAAAAKTSSTPPDTATAPAAEDDPEILRLKSSIADAEKDADLARRDLALQQDTFLSNVDHVHDNAGKAKLAGMQQDIDARQQDIDKMKVRLAALEELKHIRPSTTKPSPTQP
jgi:hypothetical protein